MYFSSIECTPVVKFHADCSRCEGLTSVHCWCVWIFFCLILNGIVTVTYQTELSLFGTFTRVIFFGM